MTLAETTAEVAHEEGWGVRETPRGSNRGPKIDKWVREGGGLEQPAAGKGHPYCASFVSACVIYATKKVGGPPQFRGGASALKLRDRNPGLLLTAPPPGEWCVFYILHPDGSGHAGLCRQRPDGGLDTREANTGPGPAAPAQDREGDGYYERTDRRVEDCSGFIRIT